MKTRILSQHEENTRWLHDLDFYRDELKFMQARLDEIAAKNNSPKALQEIERFQNQVMIQRGVVLDFTTRIKEREKNLQRSISDNPVLISKRYLQSAAPDEEDIVNFESNFSALKKDFLAFVSKYR